MRTAAALFVALLAGSALAQPATLQYLRAAAVVDELKLDKEQKEKLGALAREWGWTPNRLRSAAEARKLRERAEALEKRARAVLKPAQAGRLAEIELQAERRAAGERGELLRPAIAEALKLDKAQQAKLAEIRDDRQQEVWPLFAAEGKPDAVLARVKAHRAATRALMLAVLTAKQRAALPGLYGKPFAEVKIVPLPQFHRRTGLGSRYAILEGMRYTASPALHKELGLDAAQAKKLIRAGWRADPDLPVLPGDDQPRMVAQRAQAVEKALLGFMTAKQVARFKQVVMHRSQGPRSSIRMDLAEIRGAALLTQAQQSRLMDGEKPEDVLDDSQKAAIRKIMGNPPGRVLSGGPVGLGTSPLLALLGSPDVEKELKITDAQADSFAALDMKRQKAIANRKAAADAGKQADAAARKLLDEFQSRRLGELRVRQRQWRWGLRGLLGSPPAAALGLTKAQEKRIRGLFDGHMRLLGELQAELDMMRAAGGHALDDGIYALMKAMTRTLVRRTEAVLDGKQRAKLKESMGKPFTGRMPVTGFASE